MSQATQRPNPEQFLLFQPRPARPSWKTLSAEVREQTINLLAQMLCEHWTRTARALVEKEVSDE